MAGDSTTLQIEGNLRLQATINTGSDVLCCQYHPNGQLLAVGLADGTIEMYNTESLQPLYKLSTSDGKQKDLAVTTVQFLPRSPLDQGNSNILMATYCGGAVRLWHYPSQTCTLVVHENRSTLCATFNPDGSKFLSSGDDSTIYIYDTKTGKQLRTCERSDGSDVMNGHCWRVFAIKYFDSRIFLTGGWDKTVHYWDDRVKHSTRKFYGPHICGDGLDISHDPDHILTASWRKDAPLEVWDYKQAEPIVEFPVDPNHKSLLYCCQWLGEYVVCGGSEENLARVVDRGTMNTVGQAIGFSKGVYCVDHYISKNSAKIAVGSASSVNILQLATKM